MTRRFAMLLGLSLGLSGCGGCGEDAYPTPFLPAIDGWHVIEYVVVVGEPARFEIKLDWGGPVPAGLVWTTNYDKIVAHVGGLPVTANELTVIRNGDAGEIVEVPTGLGSLYPEAGGQLEVCQDREYPDCARVDLPLAWAHVGGGAAVAIDFPVDDVSLLVGERRAMQPMPTAYTPPDDKGVKGTTTSHETVTYSSSDTSIVSVDEQGVLEGHAAGAATLTAIAGAAQGSIQVTVTDGAPALPTGAVLVTPRPTPLPIGDSYLDGRSTDTLAISPDGSPAFVLGPDSASPDHPGVTRVAPLNLVRWTGSGLGWERLSNFWEEVRTPFFDIALDGHLFAGWIANDGTGLTILDRPGDVDAGGWQRRKLPMHPDPTTGSERETGPQWPDDFAPYNESEGISTLGSKVIIGTLPADDGVWVAYGWGASYSHYPETPASFESTCVRNLRLAHVTATDIVVEDVWTEFLPAGGCGHWLGGIDYEAFWRIALGPPEDDTDRPTILVTTFMSNASGKEIRKFQHGVVGWVVTEQDGFLEGTDSLDSASVAWSPGFDNNSMVAGGEIPWGVLGPGGAFWLGDNGIVCGRLGPYGNGNADSLFGPVFGDRIGELVNPVMFNSVRGGYGQVAMVTWGDPPDAPPMPQGSTYRTWLYQNTLPEVAHNEDPDTLGTRLSDTVDILIPDPAATPRYRSILPLADGTRVLIGQRTILLLEALHTSRSSGAGQPFDTPSQIAGGTPITTEEWTAWAVDDRVMIAYGPGPVTLQVSTDQGASASAVGVTVPSLGPPIRALSISPGVSWLLTAPVTIGPQGVQLWRLDDSSGPMTVTELPAGVWPGLGTYTDTVGPESSGLAAGQSSVWVFDWMHVPTTTDRQMVTRHYALDGTLLSEHAVLMERPVANVVGVAGTDVLVMPLFYEEATGIRPVLSSTDGGTSWTQTSTLVDVQEPHGSFPQPVRLSDGRLALVATWHPDLDAQQTGIMTTLDGVTWSPIRWVRPQGGRVQRAWATALDPAGDLLVHLGDAGTISGFIADDAADEQPALFSWDETNLEGLFVRVEAP